MKWETVEELVFLAVSLTTLALLVLLWWRV